ncbi:MAG: hypothetical protein FJ318_05890 [SAR202 cluster bacterium]|nr:hypothetical protein [SAR202 cluster bacterium]
MRSVLGVLTGILVLLALAACGSDPTPTPAPTATPTRPAQVATPTPTSPPATKTGVWKIGAVGPYSGTTGVWGASLERGMRLYADQVNAAGGVVIGDTKYTIEVVTCDAQYTTPGGTQCAQKVIVQDGVKWVVGPIGSAECRGWETVSEPLKAISMIPGGCWADGIIGPANPGQFRYGVSNRELGPGQFSTLKTKFPNAKMVAFIAIDDPTGRDSTKQVIEGLKSIGHHTVVAEEYSPRDTVDFSAYITRMLLKKPDIIYPVVLGDGGTALFYKQLAEQGSGNAIKIGSCTDNVLCIKTAGGPGPFEGNVLLNNLAYCDPAQGTQAELAFCATYRSKYNEDPPNYAITGTNVMQIFIQMAKGGGSITDLQKAISWYEANPKVRTELSGQAALGGETRYGIKRQIYTSSGLGKMKDGKVVAESRVDFVPEP